MLGVWVQSLVGKLRSCMPPRQKTKHKKKKRNNTLTNSIKTLKMVPIKKILKNYKIKKVLNYVI